MVNGFNFRGIRLTILFSILSVTACSPVDPKSKPPLKKPYSAEQRQKVDIRLFNELDVRPYSWPGLGKTREKRYELIKGFADEGYELADITLRLFNFSQNHWKWNKTIDKKAWRRLRVLAEQGDGSAQCLYTIAAVKWDRLTDKRRGKYSRLAAENNQPYCLMYEAARLKRLGELDEAYKMYAQSARLGNHTMQLILVSAYAQGYLGYPLDLGKAYCWIEIAQRPEFDTGQAFTKKSRLVRWTRLAKEQGIQSYSVYDANSWCEEILREEKL